MLASLEDLGQVAKGITGCIDSRGHVLDMASRDLATVRQKLFDLEEKVKAELKRLLRDPKLRKQAAGKTTDNQRDLRDGGNRTAPPPKYRELFDAFRKGAARSSP